MSTQLDKELVVVTIFRSVVLFIAFQWVSLALPTAFAADKGTDPKKSDETKSVMAYTVNGTKTHEDDFAVVSPAGKDRPFTDLTITCIGTATIKVKLKPTGKGVVSLDDAGPFELKPAQSKTVKMFGEVASEKKDDCIIKIQDNGTGATLADAPVTVIDKVKLYFEGNFQCRLATDNDASVEKRGILGWTYALPNEPDLDRFIRFSHPNALRKYVDFSPVKITKIVAGTPDGVEFTLGDSVIDEAVNLGPQTLFDGNNPQGNGPLAKNPPGKEPLKDFQFNIGSALFKGESNVVPKGTGYAARPALAAQLALNEKGSVDKYFRARYDKLNADWNAMTPAQRATNDGVDLDFRLKKFTGNYLVPNNGIQFFYTIFGDSKGVVDKNIAIKHGESKVLKRFKQETQFNVFFEFEKFDGEALVGSVTGHISIKP